MSNDHTHIIKSQQYEIELENSTNGYTYQSRVSQLQEHSIQGILQKVMDTYHSPKHLDKYDEIVLDLGTISAANFDRELGYKIEEALINFFKSNVYNGTLIKGNRKPIHKTQIDKFVFFLKNGYLQWDVPSYEKPVTLLTNALKDDKEQLISVLRQEGKKEVIRKRLITQLQDASLEEIVVALKNEEGVYINQSRKDIVQYQKDFTLVETSQGYFRNAIWEIILAYIFTQVTGYTNQKNFLKYLIQRIASKYNLTYKNLLQKIAMGTKKRTIHKVPNFGKIVSQLEEELIAETESTTNKIPTSFAKIFQYFLKNNALPLSSKINSFASFSKQLDSFLKENPKEFYRILFQYLQKENIVVPSFTKRFSPVFTHRILEHTTDFVLQSIYLFFTDIKKIATKHTLESKTLQAIEKQIVNIALQSYISVQKTKETPLKAFLFEVIQTLVLDQAFIQILTLYIQEKEIKTTTFISEFIKEFSQQVILSSEVTNTVYENTFVNFSTQLYQYHTKQEVVSLAQFQADLTIKNYHTASYKFIIALLDIVSKNKNYSQKNLIDWIAQRFSELQRKEVHSAVIVAEISIILKPLAIQKNVLKAIEYATKSFKKNAIEEITSKAAHTQSLQPHIVANNILLQFINVIKSLLFNRIESNNLHIDVLKALEIFSKQNNVSQPDILKVLQQDIFKNTIPQFLIEILHRAIHSSEHTVSPQKDTTQYAIDIVSYFFTHGSLPWWTVNTSISAVQKSMDLVLHQSPEKFISWFKKSKYQKYIVDTMNEGIFETFVKQLTYTSQNNIIALKQLFELFLDKDLKGILSITQQDHKTFKYILLQSLHKFPSLKSISIVEFLVIEFAKKQAVSKEILYTLLLERVTSTSSLTLTLKEVSEWLAKQIPNTNSYYKKELQKIDTHQSWQASLSAQESETTIKTIVAIYNSKPQELRFYLKRISFRRNLIQQLQLKDQKKLLQHLVPSADISILTTVFEIFKSFRKRLTAQTYEAIWIYFLDRFLLKVAISNTTQWSINQWSTLVLTSISSIQRTDVLVSLIEEVALPNQVVSEKISKEMKIQLKEQHKELQLNVDQEAPIVVENETIEGTVFIENAGIVLLGPYIPMLFERMGLTENRVFKDETAKQKAVYVLQYAVTGDDDPGEHVLLLNKIACGIDVYEPLGPIIKLTEEEKSLIDSLLEAIIAHWSAIGNTSVEGLRVSFLTRPASIVEEEKKFVMVVEQKSFDMLLDQIPWAIGQFKLRWMEKLVEVIWRT